MRVIVNNGSKLSVLSLLYKQLLKSTGIDRIVFVAISSSSRYARLHVSIWCFFAEWHEGESFCGLH